MFYMIPQLTLKHQVLSSVNPIVWKVSKLESEVTHFYGSLVENFGVFFVADFQEVDEPDGDYHDHEVDYE